MIDHFGPDKEIDMMHNLPDYVKSEEIAEFVDVFQDMLNNMYKAKSAVCNHENVVTKVTTFDSREDDLSPIIYKQGFKNCEGN